MMVPAGALPDLRPWLPLTLEQWIDKIQHILAFAVMTVLLARSLNEVEDFRRPLLAAALLTLGYSFFLELLQAPLPWRYFDPGDLVADTVGVLVALPIARQYVKWSRATRTHS